MDLIEVKKNDHLLVRHTCGTLSSDVVQAAMVFCQRFAVESIVVIHNNSLIQITSRGVVKPETPKPKMI